MIDTFPPPFPGWTTVAARAPPVLQRPHRCPAHHQGERPHAGEERADAQAGPSGVPGPCPCPGLPPRRGTEGRPAGSRDPASPVGRAACAPRRVTAPAPARSRLGGSSASRPTAVAGPGSARARRVIGSRSARVAGMASTGPRSGSGAGQRPSVVGVASVDKSPPGSANSLTGCRQRRPRTSTPEARRLRGPAPGAPTGAQDSVRVRCRFQCPPRSCR